MKNKCIECGGVYGGHMAGCPEMPEDNSETIADTLHAKVEAMSQEDCRTLLNNIIDALYPDGDESEWDADTAVNINDLFQ